MAAAGLTSGFRIWARSGASSAHELAEHRFGLRTHDPMAARDRIALDMNENQIKRTMLAAENWRPIR